MSRKNRTPEENARRAKIRELLQEANITSMADSIIFLLNLHRRNSPIHRIPLSLPQLLERNFINYYSIIRGGIRMEIRESMSRKVFLVVNTIMLALIGFACCAPMWHVLCGSISDPTVLAREGGFHLWPVAPFSLAGYQAVLSYRNIVVGYMNTILYVVGGTALNLALTIVAAYVLSRKRFLPGRVIMLLLTFTMLFNGGLIPTYLVYVRLGLINTRLAVLLSTAFNVFNMVILRTSF